MIPSSAFRHDHVRQARGLDGAARLGGRAAAAHLGQRRPERRPRRRRGRQPAHLRLHREHGRRRAEPARRQEPAPGQDAARRARSRIRARPRRLAAPRRTPSRCGGRQSTSPSAPQRSRRRSTARLGQEVLWPLVGAFQALSEDGLPVGVVNDHQLQRGELDGLPRARPARSGEADGAAAAGRRGVRLRRRGRDRERPGVGVGDPAGREAAFAAFREAVAKHVDGHTAVGKH